MNSRIVAVCLVIIGVAGCVAVARHSLDERYGPAQPRERIAATPSVAVEYERDVRPLMDKRCLVCHGCYDAPCQLKLDSYEGVLRGANPEQIYSVARLKPAAPTRLFEDRQTTAQWREAGFHPVLNEREDTAQANLQAGVMARLLRLKQDHPLPQGAVLPETFDFSLSRSQQCPTIEAFDEFAKKYPLWGMPFGFPALSPAEHRTLTDWLAAGAPAAPPAALPAPLSDAVDRWEALFNGESNKERLAARYLYEHLFLADLFFEDRGRDTVYFRLVRSSTPPGQPLRLIATRRPYDDPGVARVYYRLQRDLATSIAKTHMPYRLSPQRRDRWHEWFFDAPYSVASLPGYEPDVASNPFIAFQSIPWQSRYSFLLDEAQFTIMNFIKGPVCRGNVALDVIQDRFWVFFTTPRRAAPEELASFLATQDAHLRLPAEAQSGIVSIAHWRQYAKAQGEYLQAKGDFIRRNSAALEAAALDTVWDGDGTNSNAALTVFRHADSATVVRGLVGEPPQTAWLIDYPILERIHYLLVAGFDVFGTASHQIMTRMYMDFLRMESEMNFLAFLPQDQRRSEIARWYRGAEKDVQDYVNAYFEHAALPAPVSYETTQPKVELYQLLQQRLAPVLTHGYEPAQARLSAAAVAQLQKLAQVRGLPASIMPQVTLVKVKEGGVVSVLSDSAYTNIASMFGEQSRRLIAEDRLTVANGVIGAYPNIYLEVSERDISDLVARISTLRSEEEYRSLLDAYGVRRTNPDFWRLSDAIQSDYDVAEPIASGILDLNRYENR